MFSKKFKCGCLLSSSAKFQKEIHFQPKRYYTTGAKEQEKSTSFRRRKD
jgi:hypothetical protein